MDRFSKPIPLMLAMVSLLLFFPGGISCLAGEINIRTPRKTVIKGYRPGEMSQDAVLRTDLAYEQIIKDNRWKAVIKSSSSNQYNSHGYAWQVYGGGAAVNIEAKDISKFWTDGSYRQIQRHEAVRGDVVVMSDPLNPGRLHSAVVIDARWCMSKWADGPLVLHRLNDHPFGQTYRYFSKVKVAAPTGLTIVSSH